MKQRSRNIADNGPVLKIALKMPRNIEKVIDKRSPFMYNNICAIPKG